MTSQYPKTGLNNLGGPSGSDYNDWLIEGDYPHQLQTSARSTLRFIANITDVTKMHTMFCEGLAAALAWRSAKSSRNPPQSSAPFPRSTKSWTPRSRHG